jgi:choline-sulfatase
MSRSPRSSPLSGLASAASLAAALAACSSTHGGPTPDPLLQRERATNAEQTPPAPVPGTPAPTPPAPPPAPEAPPRVHYALAAHLARAELRSGATLVADFGVPGGAKYTLGGWLTSTGDDRVVADASAMIVPGTTAKLALPAASTDAQVIAVRARAGRRERLRVFLNTREIGRGELGGDGAWTTVRVSVAAGVLKRGENTLLLRAESPGLAVDWVKLGPAAESDDAAPPSPELLVALEGTEQALVLPDGLRAGFALEVPQGARLRTRVKGANGARLEVVAQRDGADELVLGRAAATPEGAAIDADLAPLAGQIVRIELRASGGETRAVGPAVITLDGTLPAAMRPVKNAIVYLIDTLRADKLQAVNARSRVQTPGLARFVEQAAVMAGAHTQENWTKPSVTTLLSSLFPWQHQAITTEAVVPAAVELMPETFSARGFHTGAFIANGYVSDRFGFRQGWSSYRNYVREGRRNVAQYVAADVLEWLDQRPQDKPFFLYVHTIDPHVPYKPPRQFLEMYDARPYAGVVDFTNDNELLEKIKAGRIPLDARDKAHLEALYDGEISYHDVHFNAIVDGLARRGLADDTMVIIVADHGEEFWDHGSVGHGHSVYEELLHIPMIVRLPGITQRPLRVEDAVGLVDVMPTVLEALGQPLPEGLAGQSFLPLLRGETHDAPRATVSGFMEGWRTVVSGRYKLIHRTLERQMLYDLASDPREQTDLAADRPIAVRYLRGLLGLSLGAVETTPAPSSPGRVAARPRARPQVHTQETTTIDPQTEEQLRALGYIPGARR